jgi:mono/diheme cytochrome c family protein
MGTTLSEAPPRKRASRLRLAKAVFNCPPVRAGVSVMPLVVLMGTTALAQGPTFGVGRAPTPEEIRAVDISISPTGDELPPGRGSAKEGAQTYRTKCQACHGAGGFGGSAPILKSKMGPETPTWQRGRVLPVRAPFATIVWDYINRGMPLNREGTLTADEVYALTAYLLFINQVIPEDQVLDRDSLPKVKMPLDEGEYASLPDWKPKTRRLKDYPF